MWTVIIRNYLLLSEIFVSGKMISMIILHTLDNMEHKILDNLLESIAANDS